MSSALGPGETLASRYEIEKILGKGGFGTTFAARDCRTDNRVAVKRLDLRDVEDWKSVELFEREAAILRRLNHPQIPEYIDFIPIEAEHAGLLVQELAPGRSLAQMLAEVGCLAEEEVVKVAEQLLGVLAYLGSLSPPVVHRDIKPANLIIDPQGVVRLVDFGAVKDVAARASTIGSTIVGTFGYMAPEIIRGGGEHRSDLYSLGMTMIALLTGIEPNDFPLRRLRPDFRGRASCSEAVIEVIERLTEPIPEDRYSDAAAARSALSDAVARATLADPKASLRALVKAKEIERWRADEEKRLQQAKMSQKLARRRPRVSAANNGDQLRITIEPVPFDELMGEADVPSTFAAGLIVGFALSVALLTAGVSSPFLWGFGIWWVLALLLNLAYTWLRRKTWYLDISSEGHFALHPGNPRKASLIGHCRDLTLTCDSFDPSSLLSANFEAYSSSMKFSALSYDDMQTLRKALRGRTELDD